MPAPEDYVTLWFLFSGLHAGPTAIFPIFWRFSWVCWEGICGLVKVILKPESPASALKTEGSKMHAARNPGSDPEKILRKRNVGM